MMNSSKYLLFFVILFPLILVSQASVSGYVNLKNPKNWEQKIYLSKIHLDEQDSFYSKTILATSNISDDGYFAFDKKWFTASDNLYKIHVNPIKELNGKRKSGTYKLFILSEEDSIHFQKGRQLFDNYSTDNNADKEWQKLKTFESRFSELDDGFDTEKYLLKTKGYVKDSLQILLVKLIGIKKLDDKNLLEKDIKANPEYYVDLLEELKSSNIDPSLFLYLENKLQALHLKSTKEKYTTSILINGFTLIAIILLIVYMINIKRKALKTSIIPLSKQEKNVKELIISGKSNKEIANELFISLNTVKTHITNIYGKLNITSRKELLSNTK